MSLSRPIYIADHSERLLCPLPLKIEPYRGCSIGCAYCSRSGLRAADRVIGPQPNSFRYVERFFYRQSNSMERKLIDQRCPVQIGINSDPLQPIEKDCKMTFRVLRILRDREYPCVITTKFPHALVEDEYLRALDGLPVAVQCSLSSEDPVMLNHLEPGAPSLRTRLEALKALNDAGAHVILRLWPFIPDLASDLDSLLAQAHDAGVQNVLCNFLKVHHAGGCRQRINEAVGYDYMASTRLNYVNGGVFNIASYQDQVRELLRIKELCRQHDLSLLNGDDFIHTRNWCCCCGTDGIPGFENTAKWAYYVNGWRITQHTTFEEYMEGLDCPWNVEFEEEWNKGKLARALPEIVFNQDDRTYSRLKLCVQDQEKGFSGVRKVPSADSMSIYEEKLKQAS